MSRMMMTWQRMMLTSQRRGTQTCSTMIRAVTTLWRWTRSTTIIWRWTRRTMTQTMILTKLNGTKEVCRRRDGGGGGSTLTCKKRVSGKLDYVSLTQSTHTCTRTRTHIIRTLVLNDRDTTLHQTTHTGNATHTRKTHTFSRGRNARIMTFGIE